MKTRLRAFTVMEFTIAMVLTSLVVSFGYQATGMFSKQGRSSGNTSDEYNAITTASYLLERDMLQCSEVVVSGAVLECWFPSRVISYQMDGEKLMRTDGDATDTFLFRVEEVEFTMAGMPVADGRMDHLKCRFRGKKGSYDFSFLKVYSAADNMKFYTTREH
jgi:hypothetical protein